MAQLRQVHATHVRGHHIINAISQGAVVHGFIGVDTVNLATASGDELINIPYSYKVG